MGQRELVEEEREEASHTSAVVDSGAIESEKSADVHGDDRDVDNVDKVTEVREVSPVESSVAETDGGVYDDEITLQEIEAMELLASDSALVKEKEAIAKLREQSVKIDEVLVEVGDIVSNPVNVGVIEATEAATEAAEVASKVLEETTPHPEPVLIDEAEPLPDASEIDDVYGGDASVTSGVGKNRGKAAARLKRVVDGMLTSIEKELERVDANIGQDFKLLDLDGDGVVSTGELKTVVKDFLASHNTDEEASSIVSKLDFDHDGKIMVDDLRNLRKLMAKQIGEANADFDESATEESLRKE